MGGRVQARRCRAQGRAGSCIESRWYPAADARQRGCGACRRTARERQEDARPARRPRPARALRVARRIPPARRLRVRLLARPLRPAPLRLHARLHGRAAGLARAAARPAPPGDPAPRHRPLRPRAGHPAVGRSAGAARAHGQRRGAPGRHRGSRAARRAGAHRGRAHLRDAGRAPAPGQAVRRPLPALGARGLHRLDRAWRHRQVPLRRAAGAGAGSRRRPARAAPPAARRAGPPRLVRGGAASGGAGGGLLGDPAVGVVADVPAHHAHRARARHRAGGGRRGGARLRVAARRAPDRRGRPARRLAGRAPDRAAAGGGRHRPRARAAGGLEAAAAPPPRGARHAHHDGRARRDRGGALRPRGDRLAVGAALVALPSRRELRLRHADRGPPSPARHPRGLREPAGVGGAFQRLVAGMAAEPGAARHARRARSRPRWPRTLAGRGARARCRQLRVLLARRLRHRPGVLLRAAPTRLAGRRVRPAGGARAPGRAGGAAARPLRAAGHGQLPARARRAA